MGAVPTIRVKRGNSIVLINEANFDPETEELYVEGAAPAAPKPLDRMNKEGLIAVAAEKEVELDGSETKAQILEKINTAESAKTDPAE